MQQLILVPVDGSPTSDGGLGEAIKLARVTGGRVRRCMSPVSRPYR